MNQNIVRLNEMKSVKMVSVTSKKRPIAKFMKEVAVYLTENYDNLDELEKCYKTMLDDMPDESCSEVMKIYEVRLKELRKKRKEEQEREEDLSHKRGRKAFRKVGDHHPNHPEWIWTEYKPGKFDWRNDSTVAKDAKATEPDKGSTKSEKAVSKQKTNVSKKENEPKKLTMDELLQLPTPKDLNKLQKNVLKLFKRGVRVVKKETTYWLVNPDGTNKDCVDKGTLEALQRKYNIDYVPQGFWYIGK